MKSALKAAFCIYIGLNALIFTHKINFFLKNFFFIDTRDKCSSEKVIKNTENKMLFNAHVVKKTTTTTTRPLNEDESIFVTF